MRATYSAASVIFKEPYPAGPRRRLPCGP